MAEVTAGKHTLPTLEHQFGLPNSTNPHFSLLLLKDKDTIILAPFFRSLCTSSNSIHRAALYPLKSHSIPKGAMHKPTNRAQPFKKGTIMSHRGSAILRIVSEIILSDENRDTAALRVISLTRKPLKILTFAGFEGSLPTPRTWKIPTLETLFVRITPSTFDLL